MGGLLQSGPAEWAPGKACGSVFDTADVHCLPSCIVLDLGWDWDVVLHYVL